MYAATITSLHPINTAIASAAALNPWTATTSSSAAATATTNRSRVTH